MFFFDDYHNAYTTIRYASRNDVSVNPTPNWLDIS